MKKTYCWIIGLIFIGLAILFAFTDLQISQSIANPQSGWAHFLEAYGQIPGMLVAFAGASILLRLHKFEMSFKSILAGIGLGIINLFTSFMSIGEAMGQQVGAEVNYMLAIGLAVTLIILVQIWLRRFPEKKVEEYKRFAKISVALLFLAGMLTVWAIKIPWGRWTYRDILEAGDLSLYTPWYLPQGNNGHHSFISGHTALSFCVLPIVLLFEEDKKKYTTVWILALTWGILGALSRVAIGAHFPSDVLFGAGQTMFWFFFLKKEIK